MDKNLKQKNAIGFRINDKIGEWLKQNYGIMQVASLALGQGANSFVPLSAMEYKLV